MWAFSPGNSVLTRKPETSNQLCPFRCENTLDRPFFVILLDFLQKSEKNVDFMSKYSYHIGLNYVKDLGAHWLFSFISCL